MIFTFIFTLIVETIIVSHKLINAFAYFICNTVITHSFMLMEFCLPRQDQTLG